ncbi:MAG: two-component sensor histidine kinase protein FixL [Pseudomonadota bacterium]
MLIDTRTLYIFTATLMFMVPLGLLVSLIQNINRQILIWFGLGMLSALSFTLYGLRGQVPDYISIIGANALLAFVSIGRILILLDWLGTLSRRHFKFYFAYLTMFIAGLTVAVVLHVPDIVRVPMVFLFLLGITAHQLFVAYTFLKTPAAAAGWMFLVAAMLAFIAYMVRVVSILGGFNDAALLAPGVDQLIGMSLVTISVILVNFAFMYLVMVNINNRLISAKHLQSELKAKIGYREQQFSKLAQQAGISGFSAFSGAIAHELNQPLGAMLLNLDRLIAKLTSHSADPKILNDLSLIRQDNMRAANLIKSLRALLNKNMATINALDLDSIVDDACRLARSSVDKGRVKYEVNYGLHNEKVMGDESLILQVVVNIISNALNAVRSVQEAVIKISTLASHDFVLIVIEDNGVGIKQDVSLHVFEPFESFTDKGMGLGLAISKEIMMQHSGDIGFYHNQSAGVTFVIGLPRTEESPPYIFDAAAVKQLIGLV